MSKRGMCTHSEVLFQWVSILLLQVEEWVEQCGCNSNGNKKRTNMDHEIHHQHEHATKSKHETASNKNDTHHLMHPKLHLCIVIHGRLSTHRVTG